MASDEYESVGERIAKAAPIICASIRKGHGTGTGCDIAGIPDRTWQSWLTREGEVYDELRVMVAKARGERDEYLMGGAREYAKTTGDYLEILRTVSRRYQKVSKHEVSGTDGQPIAAKVVIEMPHNARHDDEAD